MTLPNGVARRDIGGEDRLVTNGEPVYGEPSEGAWRVWDIGRSKLGVLVDREIPVGLTETASVLYLGAAAGTTVSHVADIVDRVYAIEFAARPMRELITVATDRSNVFPLLKDARQPSAYAHVVEDGIDVLVQDVATRGQAEVAVANKVFLHEDSWAVVMVKARSEAVNEAPETVFSSVLERIREEYEVVTSERLDPFHRDHLGVVARPR